MQHRRRSRVIGLIRSIADHPLTQGLWFGALMVLILFAPIGGR